MKKARLLLATLCLSLCFSSCLGPNNLTNSLRNWNAEVTSIDTVNEVIFLGLNIVVPAYAFSLFADTIFFNTWDYWAGENLISDPGPFPESFGGDEK